MYRYHLKLGGEIALELEPAADPWMLETRLGPLEGQYMKETFYALSHKSLK